MHWTSWYHCSKDTLVFPGVASLLKVLILGVPILSQAASKLSRWQISVSAQGDLWATVWSHYVQTPPPQKVTSLSSVSVSLLPPGICRLPQGEPCGDAAPSLLAVLNWTSSSTSCSWSSSRSQGSLVERSVWDPLSKWAH